MATTEKTEQKQQTRSEQRRVRSRRPERPSQSGQRSWLDVLKGVKTQITDDNINIVAAGVAFYAFLAVFPAIAAIISIYGLVADPATVQQQLSQMADILPEQTRGLIDQQLRQIVSARQALGWGLVVSIVAALWSANAGTRALFQSINIAYNEEERRGFFAMNGLTLLFTLGGVLMVILSLAIVVIVPAILQMLPLPGILSALIDWVRWPILAALALFALAVLYRVAPYPDKPAFRWISWGSGVACALWLLGSAGFSFYVSNFGNYNKTYGSIAAVVVLLFWFLLSAYAVLLGAELNAELEQGSASKREAHDSSGEAEQPHE
jgi:membrane protein